MCAKSITKKQKQKLLTKNITLQMNLQLRKFQIVRKLTNKILVQ